MELKNLIRVLRGRSPEGHTLSGLMAQLATDIRNEEKEIGGRIDAQLHLIAFLEHLIREIEKTGVNQGKYKTGRVLRGKSSSEDIKEISSIQATLKKIRAKLEGEEASISEWDLVETLFNLTKRFISDWDSAKFSGFTDSRHAYETAFRELKQRIHNQENEREQLKKLILRNIMFNKKLIRDFLSDTTRARAIELKCQETRDEKGAASIRVVTSSLSILQTETGDVIKYDEFLLRHAEEFDRLLSEEKTLYNQVLGKEEDTSAYIGASQIESFCNQLLFGKTRILGGKTGRSPPILQQKVDKLRLMYDYVHAKIITLNNMKIQLKKEGVEVEELVEAGTAQEKPQDSNTLVIPDTAVTPESSSSFIEELKGYDIAGELSGKLTLKGRDGKPIPFTLPKLNVVLSRSEKERLAADILTILSSSYSSADSYIEELKRNSAKALEAAQAYFTQFRQEQAANQTVDTSSQIYKNFMSSSLRVFWPAFLARQIRKAVSYYRWVVVRLATESRNKEINLIKFYVEKNGQPKKIQDILSLIMFYAINKDKILNLEKGIPIRCLDKKAKVRYHLILGLPVIMPNVESEAEVTRIFDDFAKEIDSTHYVQFT